jgi:sialidase-1
VVEDMWTITQRPEHYYGWATVGQDSRGTLYVAVSGGREAHVCPFGRVELIRSHDNGHTWTWPEVLMDTAIDDRDAGICITPKGTILVTTFTSLAYESVMQSRSANWPPQRKARWMSAHQRVSAEERQKLLGTWMLRSTDGGLTWSAPYRVPVNSPHGPIVLSDGRLLYAGKTMWRPNEKIGVAISSDEGASWQWLSDLPIMKGHAVDEYHELHAIQCPSGKLIVQIRNHNKPHEGETLQCESTDMGLTWSEPHSIGVWGLPSHLLRLRDNRLLMSYGYRRQPHGNQVRLSSDEGITWSEPMTISDDGIHGDLGYPSTVELKDGALLTVWYEQLKSSPQAVLRAARWRLES